MAARIKYSMGFIGGALLHQESVKIAGVYSTVNSWSEVGDVVLDTNLLQARTQTSAKRISSEVITRLQVLTPNELQLLLDGTRTEQLQVLWLAVCKRYLFVRDFAIEVLREKFLQQDPRLTPQDCDAFLNAKSEWDDDLERLAKTTREKVRQILMKLLKESELINRDNVINPTLLSKRFVEVVSQDSKQYLVVYPITEPGIARCPR